MNFSLYDPDWRHGIPRSEPPYSYEYVKDLRYITLKENMLSQKFPSGKHRLKYCFISNGKVLYQIQFRNNLTCVYQICFENTSENIDDFVEWLKSQLVNQG